MRKQNGMTIVEIMLAVVLISIVMVFIFNLLIDLRQEESLSSYKSEDQINRSIITKTIQDDFLDREIKTVSSCNTLGGSYIACLRFEFFDNTYGIIKVEKEYFYYEHSETPDGDGSGERWKLHSANYSDDYFYCYQEEGNLFYMQFVFPVELTSSVLDSKMIFDIELLYMGEIEEGLNIPKDGGELGISSACKTIT